MASDAEGAPVFLAESAFMMRYEMEKWPDIAFSEVKDYQMGAG